MITDWSKYPNFSRAKLACSHCGAEGIKPELMDRIQALRNAFGRPMPETSGYRCPQHPAEISKTVPGAHQLGLAIDIGLQGRDAYDLMKLAFSMGFTGIGVQQKGTSRFIHLDVVEAQLPRPAVWSY